VNEDKATRYHRFRRRVQALSRLTTTGLVVSLLVSGAAVGLGDALGRLFPSRGPAPSSLLAIALYTLLLAVLIGLVAFPFRLLSEWLLEQRYGLERVSLSSWLATYARTTPFALLLAVAAGLVPALAWRVSAEWWWLIAALMMGAGQLALAAAAPLLLNWFAPVRPVQRPALDTRLRQLADRAGASGGLRVYEWPETAASRRAQAALVGLGRTRRVLLSDTLLGAFQDDEIEVVVAHELSHYVHRDLWKVACARGLLFVIAFAFTHLFFLQMIPVGGGPANAAALPLMLLTVGGTLAAAAPGMLAWSRAHERRADEYALRLTGNADALLSVLRRLGALNLVEERPSALTALLASHPTVPERVAAVKAWQARQARQDRDPLVSAR
jgi:STE24 endopeptidase